MSYNTSNSSIISVRNFGAVGDGVTDDTEAIRRCFNSAKPGNTIVYNDGTYLQRGCITGNVSDINILGENALITSDASGQDCKFNFTSLRNISVKNLRFDGKELTFWPVNNEIEYSPRTHPGTIHIYKSKDCSVHDCKFIGMNWPITILGQSENISIKNNLFSRFFAGVYSYFSDTDDYDFINWHFVPKQPRNVRIVNNTFESGMFPHTSPTYWFFPRGWPPAPRDYSGGVKFRGGITLDFDYPAQHLIQGNRFIDANDIGVELQAVNSCVVSDNIMHNVGMGVSLSMDHKIVVSNNVIQNTIYAGIEVDGRYDGKVLQEGIGEIALNNNIIDSRDEYGRPANFINNYGVIVSSAGNRDVHINGGLIKYQKNGIGIFNYPRKTLINGVKIVTNNESLYGGIGSENVAQGIVAVGAGEIDIQNCHITPPLHSNEWGYDGYVTGWQRMITLKGVFEASVRNCHIETNNTAIYVDSSQRVNIMNNILAFGTGGNGGLNPSLITLDSVSGVVSGVRIGNNLFRGQGQYGLYVDSSNYNVTDTYVFNNCTVDAYCSGSGLFYQNIYNSGTTGFVGFYNNIGPYNSNINNSFSS